MSDNQRDTLLELEAIAREAQNQPYPIPTSLWGKQTAMAVYAAGYRKPRTITTVEELIDAEDPEIILKDKCGHPYKWDIDMNGEEGWLSSNDPTVITSRHLWKLAPITVLFEPTA